MSDYNTELFRCISGTMIFYPKNDPKNENMNVMASFLITNLAKVCSIEEMKLLFNKIQGIRDFAVLCEKRNIRLIYEIFGKTVVYSLWDKFFMVSRCNQTLC